MENSINKYLQLSTPEELHEECHQWFSELEFIKDEQLFLDELIKKYTIPLISEKLYTTSLTLVGTLSKEEKSINDLQQECKDHCNHIEALLSHGCSAAEKKEYIVTHHYLKVAVFEYIEQYKNTKKALFDAIKSILKSENSKLLPKT
ncbi:hypothetical protein [Ulvibacter litoralis]|uniref:Uncharacterized protein n=1 Tax=Ulvibacter litoralis TaxID=227084 RepID=A0A1G7IB26_9FLAO|nr:hypothetical protein [Ulvibacter litoralis]GHC61944.1 hypothetical protein GCM10008083_28760 [Ulvibacter litoralis]SDF09758.1 hypothetical protein SAMN05421855_105179 [Ulvibacter litoralis]